MNEPIVQVDSLTIGYPGNPLLSPFSLRLCTGDFLSIVGSNGSGKTTLVRTLLGLLPPLSGSIQRAPTVRFGYVPQRGKLNLSFPLRTEQVVMLGRVAKIGLFKRPHSNDRKLVQDLMNELGLSGVANKNFHSLSGGQFQKMLIARALACEPSILIFDEPTTGMDIVASYEFIELIEKIKKKMQLTVVMVTHDLNSVARVSNVVAILNSQVKTICVGAPEVILTSTQLTDLFKRPVHVHKNGNELSVVVGEHR